MTPDAEGFTFVVSGRAAPQGSKALQTKADGSKYMKESSDRVHPWRTKIRRAALGSDGKPLATFAGPVAIDIEFEFVKPKANKDDYPTAHNIGDGDKLTRAVWDALTQAQVIQDDAFCVSWSGSKRWGPEDRAFITVQAARPPHMRPIDPAVIDDVRSTHDLPPMNQSVVDFAQQIGVTLDPWRKHVVEQIYNPIDHKSCVLFDQKCGAPYCPAD